MSDNADKVKGKTEDKAIIRRELLKAGATALAVGVAAQAQQAPQPAGSPAVLTGAQAGRKFRAWLGNAANGVVEQLELLPIGERQVLVRTEAWNRGHAVEPSATAQSGQPKWGQSECR